MTLAVRLFSILALCVFGRFAHAGDARNLVVQKADDGGKVALVIGNSRYRSSPLKNPGNDARAMAAKLRALGFDVVLRENLGAMQVGGALREFRSKLKPGAVALFFYAGHGLQVKGVNYLPTVDADISGEEDVPRASLNVNEVLALMDESKTRLNLVFLDACRDNPFARSFRSASGGLAKVEAPSGTLISFATRPGSVAADGTGNNGLYTEKLLAAMDQPGLTIEQVLKRVIGGVRQASNGRQEPWMEGSIEGEFYFRPAGATSIASAAPLPVAPTAEAESTIATAIPGTGEVFKDCADCPEMVVIPAGTFVMGAPSYESGRADTEGPLHRVEVAAIALGRTHITRGQFAAFVRESGYQAGESCYTLEGGKWDDRRGRTWRDPGFRQEDNHPAVCLNWNDAKAYVDWLTLKSGKQYRLPSEAEWEYAARGGTTTARYWGENPDQACGYANVMDGTGRSQVPGVNWEAHNCSDGYAYTSPAASFKPNPFGLYDMIGNAWEWVEDCWHDNYNGAPENGNAWPSPTCTRHVVRGGSWGNSGSPHDSRSARRAWGLTAVARYSGFGFRVARVFP